MHEQGYWLTEEDKIEIGRMRDNPNIRTDLTDEEKEEKRDLLEYTYGFMISALQIFEPDFEYNEKTADDFLFKLFVVSENLDLCEMMFENTVMHIVDSLGVKRDFNEEDAASRYITVHDLFIQVPFQVLESRDWIEAEDIPEKIDEDDED